MRSKVVAYLLWIFGGFGCLGLHHFYLGKTLKGFIWLFTGGFFGIGALVDLFTLDDAVEAYNSKTDSGKLFNSIEKRVYLIVSRILIGALFTFSGFVKAVDPLGFSYKMDDYLTAIGPFFENFASLSLIAAVVLAAFELLIGINLLFGIRLKESTWGAALLMLFMIPLTLWIAIANPVHDCGCFGDALIISNWATFWKNIVISAFIAGIFILLKNNKPYVQNKTQWIFTVYAFVFAVGISIYCYQHLPLLDFRPYTAGTNIIEGMATPEDAERDSFDTKLIYAKNGVEKEFTLEDYPRNDSTWEFVDQVSLLIKKGYEPPIHDFTIESLEDGEITDIVLDNPSYTFLLISYDFSKADISQSEQINKIYAYAQENDYGFYAMTASVDEAIETYKIEAKAEYPICLTDKITLKTIIRSNPGLVLIKDATIINKWHVNDLPSFNEPLENSSLSKIPAPKWAKKITKISLLFLLGALLILGLDKYRKKLIQ